MKNFMQFLIPIGLIIIVGFVLIASKPKINSEKKLFVKCSNQAESYEVHSNLELNFAEKKEQCALLIKVTNVREDYIKIKTKYMLSVDEDGNIDEDHPKYETIIPYDKEVTLYTYENQIKYTFEYR